MDITIQRFDGDDSQLVPCEDGYWVAYDAMQHFYKEAIEHGMTLSEAVAEMERKHGA